MKTLVKLTTATALLSIAPFVQVSADQVILDDLIVDGSICVGFDCVNGESFGFDTLRLKENNLRIKFQDTSSSASFPTNDWQITANDSTNGGQNKFSIDDIDGGRTPFTIEAGAPSHSLYVDDGGRLGLGTSTPVVDIHVKSGNTPTNRLEQDGSSGFSPQTWDVAGNEANFFIRDATSGSTLPFRIFPGAPSNALTIEGSTGDVGIGTTSPDANIDIEDSGGPALRLTESTGMFWEISVNPASDRLNISDGSTSPVKIGTGALNNLLRVGIPNTNEVSIAGNIKVASTFGIFVGTDQLNVPDYVFAPDYRPMPLDELEAYVREHRHLPNIPSEHELAQSGDLNMVEMQMKLLEQVEQLTLYTIEQHRTIEEFRSRLAKLERDGG